MWSKSLIRALTPATMLRLICLKIHPNPGRLGARRGYAQFCGHPEGTCRASTSQRLFAMWTPFEGWALCAYPSSSIEDGLV